MPLRFDTMNGNSRSCVPIPVGFRFHPTDEELVGYYLYGKVTKTKEDSVIRGLELYKIEPWDLHAVCRIEGDPPQNTNNWYFFSLKDKKYPTGNRANRATQAGFWKATGRDKSIQTQVSPGMRKTLVFYRGRAPHGQKTDWIMHEFRLDEGNQAFRNNEADAWVVCRVFRKTKNPKSKGGDTPSSSFEEDHQMALMPAELSDSTEKHSSDGGEGGDDGGDVNYPSSNTVHNHLDYMQCKEEMLTLDNYGTPAVQHEQVMEAMLTSYSYFQSNAVPGRPDYNAILPATDFQQVPVDLHNIETMRPKIGTDIGYFSPLPNQPFLTMLDEQKDARGCLRSAPAVLDVLDDFRFHPATQLDQSLNDIIRPLDRRQHSDLATTSNHHDMVQLWNV